MRRSILILTACWLGPSLPVAAHPAFDTVRGQDAAIETLEDARPATLLLHPARWFEEKGSAGFPADYSDEAYSRDEERLRDGE